MASRLDFITAKLHQFQDVSRRHALPLTAQRRVVLEALAARVDHPTADQLYDEVRQLLPGMSRTTVYRVLETLVRLGIVQKISNPAARARFDANTDRHHHVTCVACDLVADIHGPELNELHLPTDVPQGFMVNDYSINFTGLCAHCHESRLPGGPDPTNNGKENWT